MGVGYAASEWEGLWLRISYLCLPPPESTTIPSNSLSRLYSRATQALRGLVSHSSRNPPSGNADSSRHDGDGVREGRSKERKQRKKARQATNGPSKLATPIPIANVNSDSTAITSNPSVTSELSSSSDSSASDTGVVASASNIANITAANDGEQAEVGQARPGAKKVRKRGKVNFEDIPGTRVGPEDGPWPKEYDMLETDEEMWGELRSLARPHRAVFVNYDGYRSRSRSRGDRSRSTGRVGDDGALGEPLATVDEIGPSRQPPRITVIDSVNFQPCKTLKTQDRYVVTQLDVHGEIWTLTGVFDGHLGDVTVEHVAHHLPIIIREFLKAKLPANFSSSDYDPDHISTLFQTAIADFDDAIAHDILDLFGGSIETLKQYSDAEIRRIINDNLPGQGGMYGSRHGAPGSGENWRKARLCMYGTTALVALTDPKGEGVWVANLGDCVGVLVTRTMHLEDDEDDSPNADLPARFDDPELGEWNVEMLTTEHNGHNDEEIERIKREHPGEEETCVVDRRVLGALAPTRCLGDIPFKQPPEFTRRVFYNLYPFVHNIGPWEDLLRYNKTPPYLSAEAEVVYRSLKPDADPPPVADASATKRRNSGLTASLNLRRFSSIRNRGRKAKKEGTGKVRKQRFLILASDGFTSLCSTGDSLEKIVKSWAKEMVQIHAPSKVVEETKEKLREWENRIPDPEEAPTAPVAIQLPRQAPMFFGFEELGSPASPVSATSPVPFSANSYSSSAGSLLIPQVDLEEEPMSGMSTPAYPFSIPPSRTASPMPTSVSPSSAVHSPPLSSSPHLLPTTNTNAHSAHPSHSSEHQQHLQVAAHTESTPEPVRPQLVSNLSSGSGVPRLQRPPMPHVNKSYHCTSSENMALRLLRRALSGEDRNNDVVAKSLTIDMDVSWLDDTAIVVVGL